MSLAAHINRGEEKGDRGGGGGGAEVVVNEKFGLANKVPAKIQTRTSRIQLAGTRPPCVCGDAGSLLLPSQIQLPSPAAS